MIGFFFRIMGFVFSAVIIIGVILGITTWDPSGDGGADLAVAAINGVAGVTRWAIGFGIDVFERLSLS